MTKTRSQQRAQRNWSALIAGFALLISALSLSVSYKSYLRGEINLVFGEPRTSILGMSDCCLLFEHEILLTDVAGTAPPIVRLEYHALTDFERVRSVAVGDQFHTAFRPDESCRISFSGDRSSTDCANFDLYNPISFSNSDEGYVAITIVTAVQLWHLPAAVLNNVDTIVSDMGDKVPLYSTDKVREYFQKIMNEPKSEGVGGVALSFVKNAECVIERNSRSHRAFLPTCVSVRVLTADAISYRAGSYAALQIALVTRGESGGIGAEPWGWQPNAP